MPSSGHGDNSSNYPDTGVKEIILVSPKEAIRREARTIEVEENTEFLLSPENRELASYFSRVEIKSYKDLQILGFVPRGLAEEKVRNAIAADDNEVYKIAISLPYEPARNCNCKGHSSEATMSWGKNLRATYNSIRKKHNPALANLLSDYYGKQIEWDSPLPTIIRNWHDRINRVIITAMFNDIIIHRNATLLVAPSIKVKLANNIWIHRVGGQLAYQGSYLRIWATSINSFNDTITTKFNFNPPWLQNLDWFD